MRLQLINANELISHVNKEKVRGNKCKGGKSGKVKTIQNIVILCLNTAISCVRLSSLLFRYLFPGTNYMAGNDNKI
jgi:hypothetical protein